MALRATVSLKEQVSRLTAELTADRDALGSVKFELQVLRSQLQHKVNEAAIQSVELAELRTGLNNERSSSQEKLALLIDAKAALTD